MNESSKKAIKTTVEIGAAALSAYILIGNLFYALTLTRRGIHSSIAEKYMTSNTSTDEKTIHLNAEIDQGKIWFDRAYKENGLRYFCRSCSRLRSRSQKYGCLRKALL